MYCWSLPRIGSFCFAGGLRAARIRFLRRRAAPWACSASGVGHAVVAGVVGGPADEAVDFEGGVLDVLPVDCPPWLGPLVKH